MYQIIKRIIDFVTSFILLILLFPLLTTIAILIKSESYGSIFFTQKRIGQNGALFNIYKFRSMKINTPDVATDKLENPKQYITRFGKFIRKTSIDELPQLFNILVGHMSFVGPRPALYNQYDLITARCNLGIDRIKPGLTGYAQIKGRDNISDAQKVAFDKYYLENVSFSLDIMIIVNTFIKVLKAENVRIEEMKVKTTELIENDRVINN